MFRWKLSIPFASIAAGCRFGRFSALYWKIAWKICCPEENLDQMERKGGGDGEKRLTLAILL